MLTEKKLAELFYRNMINNPNPMIATEAGVKAVKKVAALAKKNNIDFALVGGIAMHFYGGPRLTKDVDVIASAVLPLQPERKLGFGGDRYRIDIGKLKVPLDWIVRNDEVKTLYQMALEQSRVLPNGLPIITPEWLVILKYVAGRFRDQEDGVFLLKQKDLVDRKLLKRHLKKALGSTGSAVVSAGLQRWYDLADGKITTEKDDYEAVRL